MSAAYTELYWNSKSEFVIGKDDKYICYSKWIQNHKKLPAEC